MARKPTTQLIKDTKTDLAGLQVQLEDAIQVREQYNRDLKNARARLSRKEKTDYPDKLARRFVENIKKGNVAKVILLRSLDTALEDSIEFNDRTYKIYLNKVADDESIYTYSIIGSGWGVRIDVQIIYEAVAGELRDWAEGIQSFREEVLKSRGLNSEERGERATEWWYNNVFGTGLESKTIAGRLALTSFGVAPFWRILNNGSQPLGSDRPGGYNPVPQKPTFFVEKAEQEIELEFLTTINIERQKWFDEEQELREIIAQYQERRDQYSQEVDLLRTELRENTRIFNSFKAKKDFINQKKMVDVFRRLRAGEEFENPRINIGTRGHRVYILVRATEGIIEI